MLMKESKLFAVIALLITVCSGIISIITFMGDRIVFNNELFQITVSLCASMFAGIILSLYVNMKRPRKSTFILYTKDDFTDQFVIKMRNKGLSRIKTMDDIHIGDNIEEKLSDLMQNADFIIVILSKDSIKDKLLMNSIENAFKDKKIIMPLISDSIEKDEIPEEISKLKYFVYSKEDKDIDTAVSEIMHAIYEQRRKS